MRGVRLGGSTIALALLLLAGAQGCVGRHTLQPPARKIDAGDPIELAIDNRHWADVRVYVVHDGSTTRVGMVPASSAVTFPLPRYLIGQSGEIRLIADPVAAFQKLVSDVVVVKPGQQVVWTLDNALAKSTIAVY